MRNLLRSLVIAALPLVAVPAVAADGDFLKRPATIIVPYAAGSVGETLARMIGEAMEPSVGQRILIETKGGAGGNIGTAAVVRAAPDGHTLVLAATSNFVVNQFLYRDMGFDPLKDLEPVMLVADVPSFLYVRGTLPVSTLGEFVAYAKANPGKVNYASPGAGSTPHLTAELLNQVAGAGMQHIPYRGAGPAITAMLSGEVDLYLAGLAAGRQHLPSGKLRAVAVASRERQAAAPDVPTTAEAGFPAVLGSNWWGLAAPKGTPPEIVDRWAREVASALASPSVQRRFVELGLVSMGIAPKPFAERLRTEAAGWKKIVETAKISID